MITVSHAYELRQLRKTAVYHATGCKSGSSAPFLIMSLPGWSEINQLEIHFFIVSRQWLSLRAPFCKAILLANALACALHFAFSTSTATGFAQECVPSPAENGLDPSLTQEVRVCKAQPSKGLSMVITRSPPLSLSAR